MELARINEDGTLDLVFCPREQGERMAELRNTGFLDFVPSEQPQTEPGKIAVDSFAIVEGKVVQTWSIHADMEAIQAEIEALKASLSDTDYQVIKCYEANLIGATLPYDIETLHAERQAIRDKINEKEAELATIG